MHPNERIKLQKSQTCKNSNGWGDIAESFVPLTMVLNRGKPVYTDLGVTFSRHNVFSVMAIHDKGLSSSSQRQWRTQKIFMGGGNSVAYGGHLYLVFAFCDVTI